MTRRYSILAAFALLSGAWPIDLPAKAASEIRRDATVLAVERVMPSVVNISSKTVSRQRGFFFDWWRNNWSPFYRDMPPQYSVGSGVIIDEDGYLVTNVHVVEDATEIIVTLADHRNYPADLVIGTRKSDVALLKIRAKPGEKFTPIQFAADDDLYLGETVIALGNPFGLGGSVSKGILSSKTRRSTAQDGVLDMEDWIQTDAAINPGNSGGPLVNLDAQLIGLNVAIFKEGQGIGFAIPVKRISEALGEIFTPENLRSLWLGAQFQSTTNGLKVVSVQTASPAEKGGLQDGDVILRVNSSIPKSVFALNREIISSADKREISFQIRRAGAVATASVRLVAEQSYFNTKLIRQKIGLTLRELIGQDFDRIGLNLTAGFLVSDVEQGSPADRAGFQKGLIIEAINGEAADSIVSAARLLSSKKRGEKVRLGVIIPGPFRRAEVEVKVR
ncbi:MAG TPA: trypsin-like peptidase domain-containing protein [Verrucomicrobiae bacterium]|nr:trypsin-like peptidase domain-containing protein [Verrucomicrobiae bacterium]